VIKMVFGFKVFIRDKGKKFKPVTNLVFPRKNALAIGQKQVIKQKGEAFKLKPSFGELGKEKKLMKFKPQNFTKRGRVFSLRLISPKGV